VTVSPTWLGRQHRSRRALLTVVGIAFFCVLSRPAAAADQIYFSAVDNVTNKIIERINAETVRLDISAWYLTEHAISIAIANRFNAGVKVRLMGDRGSIFEIDPHTRDEFYWLANQGVPIRLRFNPTWYPEINHWKMAIFVGQNIVEFGSANWDTFELAPFSSTNFVDETVMFADDPALVNAFKTKFDRMWSDTTAEPESIAGGAPYFKDWNDACTNEPLGCNFRTVYPNPKPMVVNTARLEPDYPSPPDLIWGQGPSFNNRLIQEINNEPTSGNLQFVMYRLTVPNIAQALLDRFAAGVQMQLIIEPDQYLNRKWPEFWLSHAYWDSLWAAGIPMRQRKHQGMTHMKTLVTSAYATNASSNLAAAWQRDHNYFVPSATKTAIYNAIKNRVTAMWNDTTNFEPFVPQPPDAPVQSTPANGATGVSRTSPLVWNITPFATNFDVYLGFSAAALTRIANVKAQLVNNPPSTYSWPPPSEFCAGTTYYWQIVARTNATPRRSSLVAASPTRSFTTTGTNVGCSGLPGSGGGGGGGAVPAPWATQDIGNVGAAGNASYDNGTFIVSGAGADIWGTSDAFRYVYQSLNGDGQIVARVVSEQNTNSYAKAGVMIRSALTAGSAHAILDVRPDGNVEFMVRTTNGGPTTYVAGRTQAFPAWLKLTRSTTTITAYVSGNGTDWTQVGTTTLSIAAAATVGLIVNSHDVGATNSSTFDNVTVTGGAPPPPPPPPPPTTLPAPWTDQDVGSVGTPGNASLTNGVFTVKGAGADIWDNADGFNYAFQPFNADGQIVARVTAMDNTNSYAKAGVMIRQTTTAGSAHVLLDVRPNGTVEFMTRAANGGSTTFLAGRTLGFPAWLKLARSGNSISASVSTDGSAWITLGSTPTSMPSSVQVGLVVNSHDPQVLNTSTFDNVAVTTGTPPPPPPTAPNIVIYASDVTAANRHGSWSLAADPTAAGGSKLVTPDASVANTDAPLASPVDYFDVTFNANAGVPHTIWLRLQATANAKSNDAVWVQFSDARSNGSQVYPLNSTSGLLVNLATDGTGASLNKWGWQNGAYWLSQATTVTFATSGTHTIRVQIREDGVQLDQIVLSPSAYLSSPPGPATNDTTIVPKS
jgi:regulation of enolase protein 1 (concanavalin A-like superfamily)